MPKNADQTPNVELVKPASQAKENVFAEEVTIEILKLEGVKISMNVYPVPNRFADLMLYAIIFLEVMSVNVHLDFLEIHSADVKNVQVRKFKTIQLFSSQTIASEISERNTIYLSILEKIKIDEVMPLNIFAADGLV